MDLFEEFMAREKIAKSLAAAAECKARADAGLARIESYAAQMASLLASMKIHAASLGLVVDVAPIEGAKE